MKKKSGIIIVGSLIPEKKVQDKVRVFSTNGICRAILATDYKTPQDIDSGE